MKNITKIYLVNMLPGLGKTYLAENYANFVDYGDWLKSKGIAYSHTRRERLDPFKHIPAIASEIDVSDKVDGIYIMSAVFWDDMKYDYIKASIWIFMAKDQYNCSEVTLRDRPELCERFGDRLNDWNDRSISDSQESTKYVLDSTEHVDLEDLRNMALTSKHIELDNDTYELLLDDDTDISDDLFNKEALELDKTRKLVETPLQEHKKQIVEEKGSTINKSNSPNKIDSNFAAKNKLFNFRKVDLEYYIINDRAVIVFQLKSRDKYCYWDLLGKEDHRVTVSAKGPFDNTLNVLTDKTWSMFRLSEEDFLSSVNMTEKQITDLWAEYSMNWYLNLKELLIYKV